MKDLFQMYSHVTKSWSIYWTHYGGFPAIFKSPYFHFSLFFSLVLYPIWTKPEYCWFNLTISIMPNLLGFTLGGYAILLAFGGDKFRDLLRGEEGDTQSDYLKVNSTFIHFIVVQIFSLLSAIALLCWDVKTGVFAWFGFLLLLYAIFTGLASAMAILRMASWFDKYT